MTKLNYTQRAMLLFLMFSVYRKNGHLDTSVNVYLPSFYGIVYATMNKALKAINELEYVDVKKDGDFVNVCFDEEGIKSLVYKEYGVLGNIPFCNLFIDYLLDGHYQTIKDNGGGFSSLIVLFNMYIPLIRRKSGGDLLINIYCCHHYNPQSMYSAVRKMSERDKDIRLYSYHTFEDERAKPYFEINIKNIIRYCEG
jgi:hypothetical protein